MPRELTPVFQVKGNRGAETLLERCLVALGRRRDSFSPPFCLWFLVSLQKDLVTVRLRLKLEAFWSSRLLKNSPDFNAKVRERLKLECSLN